MFPFPPKYKRKAFMDGVVMKFRSTYIQVIVTPALQNPDHFLYKYHSRSVWLSILQTKKEKKKIRDKLVLLHLQQRQTATNSALRSKGGITQCPV